MVRPSGRTIGSLRALTAAIAVAAPLAIAYRFALVYRERAGFPRRWPPIGTPGDVGLAWEPATVESPAGPLPAWFAPARGGASGPGLVLIHGWESNRARMVPNARFLVAAGFHCLMFDVRGHGENSPERLPITVAEFAADTTAAVSTILARPEVTSVGLLGHSYGAAGALVAAACDPRVIAVVSTAAPAAPARMIRQTFRLAGLRIPAPVAGPLAALTARVFVRPRGHTLEETSARAAAARYGGSLLLVHGSDDETVPVGDLGLLESAGRTGRDRRAAGEPAIETLVISGGRHRWLYEHAEYRRVIAAFLARTLGGPLDPARAGALAAAVDVTRPADTDGSFAALERTSSAAKAVEAQAATDW